jgi:hypothetical protein
VVYALGLNLVVATLRVTPPWGGEPLGLPVNMRLYRKGGRSHIELAEDMVCQIEGWLPGRVVVVCADGAYASLARASLSCAHVVSRMQRNAALFEAAPARTGQRGRPRKRGATQRGIRPSPRSTGKTSPPRRNTVSWGWGEAPFRFRSGEPHPAPLALPGTTSTEAPGSGMV